MRCDVPVPGIVPMDDGIARSDVGLEIRLGAGPSSWPIEPGQEGGVEVYESSVSGVFGGPNVRVDHFPEQGIYRYLYDDGIVFLISGRGDGVWGHWPERMSLEDLTVYLLGPVLGFAMRLRGLTALHASAVVVGSTAMIFVGPGGAGKSTIAAGLGKRGYPVLSDDVSLLDESGGDFFVRAAYPQIRLWPKSAEALFGGRDALPKLAPSNDSWDKRFVNAHQEMVNFQESSVRLGRIFFLEDRMGSPGSPVIRKVEQKDALVRLLSNTYAYYATDRAMKALEFETLGRLIWKVPSFSLQLGGTHEGLSELGPALEKTLG